jgi:hypothetical protein
MTPQSSERDKKRPLVKGPFSMLFYKRNLLIFCELPLDFVKEIGYIVSNE